MKLTKKRGKSIILIVLIALALFSAYILNSGSESFAVLDVDNIKSVNDPILKTVVKATEECNKLEEAYKPACYEGISYTAGLSYDNFNCENLKEELKPHCYYGYGRRIGKEYSPNIEIIQEECSKIKFYESCLFDALIPIGEESAKHIETEQCKKFEQENLKQRCYQGIGRQLARDSKEQNICEKVENKEACLQGYAFITDRKGNRKEALQICDELSEKYAKGCYIFIGINSIWAYNKTIKEAFKDCERYPYKEDCKQGAAQGVAAKFFKENALEEKQQENKAVLPTTFAVYKTINPPATKISSVIKQQVIPHFINYKLTYLLIIFSALQIIVIIRILKNKKVQELSKILFKESKILYKELARAIQKTYKTIIQDI